MSAAATAVRTMLLVLVLVLVTSRDKVAPTVVLVAEISRESDQLMVRGERVRLVPGIRAAAHDCCYTTEERYIYLYVLTNAIANISVLIYLIIYLSPFDRANPVILITGVPVRQHEEECNWSDIHIDVVGREKEMVGGEKTKKGGSGINVIGGIGVGMVRENLVKGWLVAGSRDANIFRSGRVP